jgi:hypothetical protein
VKQIGVDDEGYQLFEDESDECEERDTSLDELFGARRREERAEDKDIQTLIRRALRAATRKDAS